MCSRIFASLCDVLGERKGAGAGAGAGAYGLHAPAGGGKAREKLELALTYGKEGLFGVRY